MSSHQTVTPAAVGRPAADGIAGRLLRRSQAAGPEEIVDQLVLVAAESGAEEAVLYLVDYDHTVLTVCPSVDSPPADASSVPVSVEGSLPGRCFVSGQPLAIRRDTGWQVWIPVTERGDRLGVLEMTVPAWNDRWQLRCLELGVAVAHLLVVAERYTDRFHVLRRRQDMSTAAEMQWGLLPPVSFRSGSVALAGLLEPAYHVGGDCFDYAIGSGVLEVAVFDAMGHGLASALLAALAVGTYRNARRRGLPLAALVADIDRTIAEYGGGDRFVTALVGRLELGPGRLCWVSAGHPAPLVVRHGSTVPPPPFEPGLPLGLGDIVGGTADRTVQESQLEPGDGVLLFTDGVIDARTADGEEFGEQRLRDLVERESSSGRSPAELLRRLVHSAIAHQGGRLADDATLLYLRWEGPTATAPDAYVGPA